MCALSRRAYSEQSTSSSWEEIWEAGPFYDRISDCLETAKEDAIFVGWQIDSRLPMKRPGITDGSLGRETLKQKLIRLCDSQPQLQIYLLMWDHAYLYALERETWQARIWENIHPRIHFVFDNRHLFGGSHHEKLCIIDGRIAFCGGIDLCDERWDSPQHLFYDPRRSLDWKSEKHGPYHDLAVQVTGPICEKLQNHIAKRWRALCEIPFPSSPRHRVSTLQGTYSGHRVYLSRTSIPIAPSSDDTSLIREVEFLFRDLILSAERRIILEGQYYWSPQINDFLIGQVLKMKNREFEIFLILTDLEKTNTPTSRMAPYQYQLLQKLKKIARLSGTRLICGTPYVLSRPIYIHSKVLIIDDRYLSIGSANLATRALRLDTELNLTLEARNSAERNHISRVGNFIIRHWIQGPQSSIRILPIREPLKQSQFPWEIFFDPNAPWGYLLKRKLLGNLPQDRRWMIVSIFPFWLMSSLLILQLNGLSLGSRTAGPGFYCLILSMIWALRMPFVLTLLILSGIYDSNTTSQILVYSIWIGATWSYTLARFLPGVAARINPSRKTSTQAKKTGGRSFSALLWIILDPRINLHTKISYPGLYFMPLPWFILGTGLILPALIYPWLCVSEWLLFQLATQSLMIKQLSQLLLPVFLLCWIGKELKKNDEPAKTSTQCSFLQYSQRIQPK